MVEKLLLALGLVLAVEGAMYALFPTFLRRMVRQVDMVSDVQLRRGGLIAMLSGVALVWLVN
ncbi:MAG: DUF2065 domain-containing protein [PS1 clade bacterium]|nr:DUF2065 domain-containing protein [PS1 clade bacterium]HCQ82484.1 DUF2065 domain-containing protein [Rhodobiaceae bacterium]